jgi:hypothetical protein
MNSLIKAYLEKATGTFSVLLPQKAKVLVKKGDRIAADQVIAKGEKIFLKEFDLAKILGLSGKKVIDFLVKQLGGDVAEGDLVAERGGMLKKKQFFSPVAGNLLSLSEEGILKIKVDQDSYEVRAPLAGKVKTVGKGKVEISFPAQKIVGVWGKGNQTAGALFILGSPEGDTTIFDLKEAVKSKVIAFSGFLTAGLWHKAVALDVSGIICGKLPNEQFGQDLEKEFLNLNGKEKGIRPPLLVVGGGKEGLIKEEIWRALEKAKEKTVVLKGEEKCLFIPD